MKDFIFIIGPSAVGKTTLAKKLFENYKGVYIEQNMVPEFKIPEMTEDEGIFEEKICWENILEQLWFFYKNNFRNIIALDFDDLRTRDIPIIFKGYNFIILKLISSDSNQIKEQMIKRHNNGIGLFDLDNVERANEIIKNRHLLPNEFVIDVYNKNENQVFKEAINIIDNSEIQMDYEYILPDKKLFTSWIQSYNLK